MRGVEPTGPWTMWLALLFRLDQGKYSVLVARQALDSYDVARRDLVVSKEL